MKKIQTMQLLATAMEDGELEQSIFCSDVGQTIKLKIFSRFQLDWTSL